MKKRLITSALPYVNNIPHLGNLIQVLSADVFARFCRMRGYETMYVCGTDEYGTATETKAREEGISPRELCDRYHVIHRDIYKWFNIQFDHFGRTSTPEQTEIVQDIFTKVRNAGYLTEHTTEQLYSEHSKMFLADRFVKGICPNCKYPDARGDQCENCGKLLDPSDLIDPKSVVDGTTPVMKSTKHLYINLPALKDKLEAWMKVASVKGKWSKNAVQMTQSWIRDGLKERAITRDLKWGIPVPLEGFEEKVFYVWFDAPIGYISITAEHTKSWQNWWKRPDDVELFQFIGKDNIPFHTVIFPSSLLATGEDWTMLHHMSSSEYLNYENGKFSKSKGVGVFGTDAKDTGIPADVWRFYMFYNRPETSDYTFTWKDFQEKVNKELIGNLGNLVNRTLSLWQRYYGTELPTLDIHHPSTVTFWDEVRGFQEKAAEHLEWADLRDGLRTALEVSAFGNKLMQDSEPWKLQATDPHETRRILANLVYLVRDIAIMVRPYIPETAKRIGGFLGIDEDLLVWSKLAQPGPLAGETHLAKPELLFKQLESDHIDALRVRFAGSQAERSARDAAETATAKPGKESSKEKKMDSNQPKNEGPAGAGSGTAAAKDTVPDNRKPEEKLAAAVELRVAKIVDIAPHPDAEKLYVETLDDGSGTPRVILSGLRKHYTEEELRGKHIILVANLAPRKMRGIVSNGMLLAASTSAGEGSDEIVDVIFAPQANPGDIVEVEGFQNAPDKGEINADFFFSIPLRAEKFEAKVGSSRLLAAGKVLKASKVSEGEIG